MGEEVLVYDDEDKQSKVPFLVVACTGTQLVVTKFDVTKRKMYTAFQIKPN